MHTNDSTLEAELAYRRDRTRAEWARHPRRYRRRGATRRATRTRIATNR